VRIIWDWNGTLLDDNHASLSALNAILSRRGLKTVSLDHYRRNFAFPVRHFYESLGVKIECEDWDALAQEYHDAYHESELRLAADAKAALELVKARGIAQAVVSAMREDYLLSDMDKFGIRHFFEAVLGTNNLDGCSKLSRIKDYVALAGEDEKYVVIGDSLHDKEVADAIGARCVFYGGGSHDPSRLSCLGPVAMTLFDAVQFALKRIKSNPY
jgi:phosphoglycolate phosphatase